MDHMNDFKALGLPTFLVESLERANITKPTPIQAESVPVALQGSDILASAQTGSGKTIAYLIPLIVKLLNNPSSTSLILLPTRELAIQVKDALNLVVGREPGFGWTVLIGGESIVKQLTQLRRNPRIVIGTPGRVYDHLERKSLNLKNVGFFVLDEADRMLDMGFSDQLDNINKYVPTDRQTLMFSATVPSNIERMSKKYLTDPKRVAIGSSVVAAADIKQEVVHTPAVDKFARLLVELDQREGSVVVFVKTKRGAESLAYKLKDENHSADAIHGNLQQRRRERVVSNFRKKMNRIMVATDIAARGLDVPHVEHVINYDLPSCPEDYVHRIGRTGRAGAKGSALSFVSPEDAFRWRNINRFMNPDDNSRLEKDPAGSRFSRGGRGGSGSSRFSRGGNSSGFKGKGSFADKREGSDRSSFAGKREFDRPSFAGKREGSDRPSFAGKREFDRPSFAGKREFDRPSFAGKREFDRPPFAGKREGSDRPSFAGKREFDRPSFAGKREFDRPPFAGKREGSDRPSFAGKREFDRPPFAGKSSFGGDRFFSEGKNSRTEGGFGQGRSSSTGSAGRPFPRKKFNGGGKFAGRSSSFPSRPERSRD